MPSSTRSVLVGAILLAALSACTDIPGDAQPAPSDEPTASSSAAPPSTSATVSVPPRPANLDLAGIDPCKLLTPAQLDQLKVDREPRSGGSSGPFDAPVCNFSVDARQPRYSYAVYAVGSEGFESWLTGERNVESALTEVAGFPAAEFHPLGVEDSECSTAVSVADGQQLIVQMAPTTPKAFKQDQLCDMSEQAAALAVATLQSLK